MITKQTKDKEQWIERFINNLQARDAIFENKCDHSIFSHLPGCSMCKGTNICEITKLVDEIEIISLDDEEEKLKTELSSGATQKHLTTCLINLLTKSKLFGWNTKRRKP